MQPPWKSQQFMVGTMLIKLLGRIRRELQIHKWSRSFGMGKRHGSSPRFIIYSWISIF